MEKYYTCCICGQVFTGYGNNPWPVNDDEDARCCDTCNADVVIPARVKRFTGFNYGTEQSE